MKKQHITKAFYPKCTDNVQKKRNILRKEALSCKKRECRSKEGTPKIL